MKPTLTSLIAVILLSISALAQTTPPPNPSTDAPAFTLSASVLSLPGGSQTSAATDIGATFAVTPRFLLRSDNIIAPAVNTQAFFGGVEYRLNTHKILGSTNLDETHFGFYVTASAGQARITVGTNPEQTHFAALAGGGVNYDPTGSGKFSVNLAEVRWAKLPGLSNNTVIVSSGLKLGF